MFKNDNLKFLCNQINFRVLHFKYGLEIGYKVNTKIQTGSNKILFNDKTIDLVSCLKFNNGIHFNKQWLGF